MIKLTPLKKPKPLGKFAVFDIEARDWTNFDVLGYYDGTGYEEFNSVRDFIVSLFKRNSSRIPTTVFAHFGGKYDFLFLIDSLIDMGGYEIQNCVPRGSSLLCLDIEFQGRVISFRDTAAFLSFGLERLTKKFNVDHKKKKFDFTEYNAAKVGSAKHAKMRKELCEYLRYDCIGLYEVIWKYALSPQIQKAGFAFTSASQSLRLFRTYLREPIPGVYGEAENFVRKGFYGGRTEPFKPLFDNGFRESLQGVRLPDDKSAPNYGETIKSYDFNSLYASVLENPENRFPGGVEGLTDKLDLECLGYFWVKLYIPEQYMPPLPFVHKGKLLFPCGFIEGVWSAVELKNAVENYGVKILRCKSGYKFHDIGNPFTEFIREMYALRIAAKEAGDGVGDVVAKLGLNSLWGRFALRKDRENFAFDENQKDFDGKWWIERGFKNIRLGTVPIHLTTSFSNVAIGGYVTSYARIRNVNTAAPWAEKSLYYTDTDNFQTPLLLKTSKNLGDLKLESTGDTACFLLPKTYIIKASEKNFEITLETDDPDNPTKTNKKVVMKGFSSRKVWRSFDIDQFKGTLEGEANLLRVVNEPKFATFKRALQQKKVLAMLDAEPKQIRSKYSKRIVFKNEKGNYDTRPILITETGELK